MVIIIKINIINKSLTKIALINITCGLIPLYVLLYSLIYILSLMSIPNIKKLLKTCCF